MSSSQPETEAETGANDWRLWRLRRLWSDVFIKTTKHLCAALACPCPCRRRRRVRERERRRRRSQAKIVWAKLFVMGQRLPGSNVTRCVKIIDFPWLDCCWLSKFNHNMAAEERQRLREIESEGGRKLGRRAEDRSSCCYGERQHVAKLTTWIFNFASQQRQVICCVDVPGVADEQWPGTRHPAASQTRSETGRERERARGGRGGSSSCRSIHFNANNSYKFMCNLAAAADVAWNRRQIGRLKSTLSPVCPHPSRVYPSPTDRHIVGSVTQYVRPLQLPSCKVQRNSLI